MRCLLVNLILFITLSAYGANMTPYIADMIPRDDGYLCKKKFSDGVTVSYKLLAKKYRQTELVEGFNDSGEYVDDIYYAKNFCQNRAFCA